GTSLDTNCMGRTIGESTSVFNRWPRRRAWLASTGDRREGDGGGRWRADRKTRKRAFWTGMGSPPSSKTRTRRRRTASWTKKKSSSSSASKSKTVSHGIGLLMEAAQGDPERHRGLPPLVRRAE